MLKTSVKNLIQIPETSEIAGVKAESDGKEIYIKANRGVVLSCGGYENNPEMFAYYNHPGLRDFIFSFRNSQQYGRRREAGIRGWRLSMAYRRLALR